MNSPRHKGSFAARVFDALERAEDTRFEGGLDPVVFAAINNPEKTSYPPQYQCDARGQFQLFPVDE